MEEQQAQRPMKLVLYRCTKCGAYDCPIVFLNEQYSHVIICASCHAGSGMKPDEQFSRKAGAFVVAERLIDLATVGPISEIRAEMQRIS